MAEFNEEDKGVSGRWLVETIYFQLELTRIHFSSKGKRGNEVPNQRTGQMKKMQRKRKLKSKKKQGKRQRKMTRVKKAMRRRKLRMENLLHPRKRKMMSLLPQRRKVGRLNLRRLLKSLLIRPASVVQRRRQR